jgi:release factor glutamine methyltransferase
LRKNSFSPFQNKVLSVALAHTRQCIGGLTETPGLDAQVLLAHVCKKDKSWLHAHPEYKLSAIETLELANALAQLSAGVPLPYVIGEWDFFSLHFRVTPDVLIPRPETELLVETAIKWLQAHPERNQVAEAGTGSGCISISLAVNLPHLQITATDISPEALAVASYNTNRHNVHPRVQLVETNLLDGLPGPFDLICANLPYIPTDALHQLPVFLREPTLALDGGPDGLDVINQMLSQTGPRLSEEGLLLLEIESDQANQAVDCAERFFPQAEITTKLDLAGHHRLVSIQT